MSGVAVWVGPLCRYFAEDSEHSAADLRLGVDRWATDVGESLGSRLKRPLAWGEDPAVAPEITVLDRSLDAVRLLAVYAQSTDHGLPDALPGKLADDRVWDEAERASFQKSHYGQLLVADCWLPGDFDFTFRVPRPDGEDWTFGSLAACRDQLHFLDARTVDLPAEARAAVAAMPLEQQDSFVKLARAGLARLRNAVDAAHERGLPAALRRS